MSGRGMTGRKLHARSHPFWRRLEHAHHAENFRLSLFVGRYGQFSSCLKIAQRYLGRWPARIAGPRHPFSADEQKNFRQGGRSSLRVARVLATHGENHRHHGISRWRENHGRGFKARV